LRARSILLAAALALVAAASGGCDRGASAKGGSARFDLPADSEAVVGALHEFELVERSGRAVRLADLRGAPFVLAFVFTTCSGPCPRISGAMSELQRELAGSPVRLVTVSVDPETDTPEVLSRYARSLGADPERWLFLTGDERQIDALALSALAARAKDPSAPVGMQVTHSTRLLVVDAAGRIRGLYPGETGEGRQAARERALWLAGHPGR
jgi:cytochrome oxidase Cu insertion factor (SCO1/SenC/PrrC family)